MILEDQKESRSVTDRAIMPVHPAWEEWMEASAYQHKDARKELGLGHSTYFRRIAKAPTTVDRLAMRALYEGLEPFTGEVK